MTRTRSRDALRSSPRGRGFGPSLRSCSRQRGDTSSWWTLTRGRRAAAAASGRTDGRPNPLPCDVAAEQQVEAMVGDVVSRLEGSTSLSTMPDCTRGLRVAHDHIGLAKVRRLFDVNVMGTIICHPRRQRSAMTVDRAMQPEYLLPPPPPERVRMECPSFAVRASDHGLRFMNLALMHSGERGCARRTDDTSGPNFPGDLDASKNNRYCLSTERERHRRGIALPVFGPSTVCHRETLESPPDSPCI